MWHGAETHVTVFYPEKSITILANNNNDNDGKRYLSKTTLWAQQQGVICQKPFCDKPKI